MTQCVNCDRKAQLFLCPTCITELRGLFVGLPRFLRHLHETAYGQATLADDGRHTRSRGYHLDGDAEVETYGRSALAVFLSAGRCNPKALTLLDDVRTMLGTWARHLCETRGTTFPVGSDSLLCGWLARHVSAIGADEAAKECYRDVSDAVVRIERAINPPVPPRLCGPCPSRDEYGIVCGTRLMAPPRDTTVRCPQCGAVHDVGELIGKLLADVEDKNFTVQELSVALGALRQPVPVKTLYRWTYEAKLVPRGWRGDKPVYRLADARRLSERQRAS